MRKQSHGITKEELRQCMTPTSEPHCFLPPTSLLCSLVNGYLMPLTLFSYLCSHCGLSLEMTGPSVLPVSLLPDRQYQHLASISRRVGGRDRSDHGIDRERMEYLPLYTSEQIGWRHISQVLWRWVASFERGRSIEARCLPESEEEMTEKPCAP